MVTLLRLHENHCDSYDNINLQNLCKVFWRKASYTQSRLWTRCLETCKIKISKLGGSPRNRGTNHHHAVISWIGSTLYCQNYFTQVRSYVIYDAGIAIPHPSEVYLLTLKATHWVCSLCIYIIENRWFKFVNVGQFSPWSSLSCATLLWKFTTLTEANQSCRRLTAARGTPRQLSLFDTMAY